MLSVGTVASLATIGTCARSFLQPVPKEKERTIVRVEPTRSTEARERANIVVDSAVLRSASFLLFPFTPQVEVTIKNTGTKQAENIRLFGLIEILDATTKTFGRVNTKQKTETRKLAPQASLDWPINLGRHISSGEGTALALKTSAIFAQVEIYYDDDHWAKCRLSYHGLAAPGWPFQINECSSDQR